MIAVYVLAARIGFGVISFQKIEDFLKRDELRQRLKLAMYPADWRSVFVEVESCDIEFMCMRDLVVPANMIMHAHS
eukprot:SAG11_NODE_1831_length_4191_cov_4.013930_4_plen_76_part_00